MSCSTIISVVVTSLLEFGGLVFEFNTLLGVRSGGQTPQDRRCDIQAASSDVGRVYVMMVEIDCD